MLNPDRLPSGTWRVRVTLPTGRVSVTDKDRSACIRKAALLIADPDQLKASSSSLTLSAACQEYISMRSHVLSPFTVTTYTRYLSHLHPIGSLPLRSLNHLNLQQFINAYAATHSPKSTRSLNGFIMSVIKTYIPDSSFNLHLPQKQKSTITIPDDAAVLRAISSTDDSYLRLAIVLCAFLGLRRGEISALTWHDLTGTSLHICHAIAKAPDGSLVTKSPKTLAGDRVLPVPPSLLPYFDAVRPDPLTDPSLPILPISPDAITRRWERLCSRIGISFRFYDLRHYNASTMLSLGIPDLYAMQRMGHATPNMLKTVYQHLQESTLQTTTSALSSHADQLLASISSPKDDQISSDIT